MRDYVDLSVRFRKVAWGRLAWRDTMSSEFAPYFDADDVCIVRDGTETIHYKTLDAFVSDLEEWEMWEAIVAEDMGETTSTTHNDSKH